MKNTQQNVTEQNPMVQRLPPGFVTHYLRHCRRYRAVPNGVTTTAWPRNALFAALPPLPSRTQWYNDYRPAL